LPGTVPDRSGLLGQRYAGDGFQTVPRKKSSFSRRRESKKNDKKAEAHTMLFSLSFYRKEYNEELTIPIYFYPQVFL
jgi:hypothetical protein